LKFTDFFSISSFMMLSIYSISPSAIAIRQNLQTNDEQ